MCVSAAATLQPHPPDWATPLGAGYDLVKATHAKEIMKGNSDKMPYDLHSDMEQHAVDHTPNKQRCLFQVDWGTMLYITV